MVAGKPEGNTHRKAGKAGVGPGVKLDKDKMSLRAFLFGVMI